MIVFAWLISTVLWLGVWIPFYILGFAVTWLGLLFCKRSDEHMSFPFWFWDSNAGINGTIGYENLNWVAICNPWVKTIEDAKSVVNSLQGNERKYGNRWIWITWRNPVTNVSRYLIGRGENKFSRRVWTFGPLKLERLLVTLGWSYALTWDYGNGKGFFYRFGWKYDDIQQGRACFMYRISPGKTL